MDKRRIFRRVVAILVILAAGLYWLWPVTIRADDSTRLALLLRHKLGEIRFVNSVTGRPVEIALQS